MSAATTRSLGKAGKNTPRKLSKNANFKAATATKTTRATRTTTTGNNNGNKKNPARFANNFIAWTDYKHTHTHRESTATIREGELHE